MEEVEILDITTRPNSLVLDHDETWIKFWLAQNIQDVNTSSRLVFIERIIDDVNVIATSATNNAVRCA